MHYFTVVLPLSAPGMLATEISSIKCKLCVRFSAALVKECVHWLDANNFMEGASERGPVPIAGPTCVKRTEVSCDSQEIRRKATQQSEPRIPQNSRS